MTVDQLEIFYGSKAAAARAIGITPAAVSNWGDTRIIPIEHQIKWELDSRGALRADLPRSIREQVA